jgi:hypothetical protein
MDAYTAERYGALPPNRPRPSRLIEPGVIERRRRDLLGQVHHAATTESQRAVWDPAEDDRSYVDHECRWEASRDD